MAKKGQDKLGLDLQYLKFLRGYTLCREVADYPFQWLMVEPTNQCNLRCVMCPQAGKMTRKKGFMEFSLFRKVIDEAEERVKSVQLFHSGESLLHPRISDMIHYTASKNIYTLINTNGTILNEEKARSVLDSGLNSISFSFDSFHKHVYESIRVGASFEKTLRNIERFLNLKAQKNQKWPRTIIEIIDMKDTRPYIKAFMDKAKEMGFDDVRIWKFHNWTDADGIVDRHSPFLKNRHHYYPCEYPFFIMAVYWDGTVVPCCIDYNGTYPLGKFPETSLTAIWNNKQSRYLRTTMRTKNTPKTKLCQDCSFLIQPRSSRTFLGKIFSFYAKWVGALRL